ncbi:SGNH/GDSL hydrolase family protein [Paucibacter sp. DJ2R-2]|uniref:SGNH/GDSL hydrolase family protein n=1 Tax=Paucibacter sp. DJ2R-2 TaxID=2893558 RepID=UPI0021E4BE3A|nr:SGNH/GDSL hydrolase family protein [Paucibacter sp. DJ2R-2]MCV2422652.1 SGNH/GDSL hydrolase family protein [Paucibacter sp. DJ4R-1]MCV2438850.1 SGNH/GDSL hydrolase family protein [Paucibacter sp. DJ2R-2]
MLKLLFPMVAILLASCGGGDAPASATCTALPMVRIQLFGDSTQVGFDSASPGEVAPHNPAAALQAFFDARYGLGKVKVSSRAVNGSGAWQLVAGSDTLNLPWPGSVAAEIVVVNHGINDFYLVNDIAAYRKNLQTLSMAPGARVVFETPNVLRKLDISPFVRVMREVAAEKGLPLADVFAYTSALPDWPVLLHDNAHPSDSLYQMISRDVLQPTIAPIVAQMLCR